MKMMGWIISGAAAYLLFGLPALAQENTACDAACDVPCYFGECAPAKASYEAALARCDLDRLDMIGRFYQGTISGEKAAKAATRLRSTSGIASRPNGCASLIEPQNDACEHVAPRPGFSCTIENGVAMLLQETSTPTGGELTKETEADSAAPGSIGPRPSSGQARSLYDDCIAGDARYCNNLGISYERSEHNLLQNYSRAVAAFVRACDGGFAAGCFNLGVTYLNGIGVSQDDVRAVGFFRQACDGGDAKGCSNLGVLYEIDRGVSKNYIRAITFYRRACDGEDANACNGLGAMYGDGRGVPQNDARAAVLFRRACDGGDATGCSEVARLV